VLDTWTAVLSDGTGWAQSEPGLQGWQCSPWRRLEELAQETDRKIVVATACLGNVAVALTADAWTLSCGQSVITRKGLGADAGKASQVRIRWVCRREQDRWLWRATDGHTAWEVVTPPGEPLHRHLDV